MAVGCKMFCWSWRVACILVLFLAVAPAFAQELESFENVKAGPFRTLNSSVGKWTCSKGRVQVDDRHARTGKQCLQIQGGKKTVVHLELPKPLESASELTFWAERWTSREPFKFQVEAKANGSSAPWETIFSGDREIQVGRSFRSYIRVPLKNPGARELRFTVSSPEGTGVLIDDLRVAPSKPQEIVRVEVVPSVVPALVNGPPCQLAQFKVVASGTLHPIKLTRLTVDILGAEKVRTLQLLCERTPLGDSVPIVPTQSENIELKTKRMLKDGENLFQLVGTLDPGTGIEGRIGARIREVGFSDGQVLQLQAPASRQRLGVALRQAGQDNVHTYRIPGLATTKRGTLLAVYDVRRSGGRDLPGDIDVGMSRSTDGGRTWEPMKIIMDMGNDPQWKYEGVGDPAILVDQQTGTVWVAGIWSHGNRGWHGSGPGLSPEETGQLMLVRSDDDGKSWSKPMNITKQVKDPKWCFLLQGPGKGITMRDGTLVFAAQFQDAPENQRLPRSTILYSRDHGQSWEIGTGAFDDTTESQVVEIEPGVLMLNCRYNRKSTRVVMTSSDLGRTWQKHATSESSLVEPRACMASLIDVNRELEKDSTGWLLFSNPDDDKVRRRITIKASADRGVTWPKENKILLDEGRGAGYSCMTMIDEKTVGILYEGSQAQLTFQRIPLSELNLQ